MGNLIAALVNSTGALQVYGRVFDTIENNITNANTPGYARQDVPLVATASDPAHGLAGGVAAGPTLSARSEYLELNVRNQQQGQGFAQQTAQDLAQIEPLFDLTSTSGVAGGLNTFFNSFSQLAVNPNDAAGRQNVINQAGAIVQAFHQNALGVQQVLSDVDSQTRDSVGTVNRLAGQIAALNQQYQSDATASSDGGLDTQIHTALEALSQVANFTVVKDADGAFNVYLGGQTALVVGAHQYSIQTNFTATQTGILDAQGNEITSQITQGSLGALLREKNTTLPGYLAQLNTLAASFADQVNQGLSAGVDQNGAPGAPLFTYNLASDAASTVAVTGITSDQIAAATPAAPGGNGNAVLLSQLAGQPLVNGLSFTQFYGNLAGQVGSDISVAKQNQIETQDTVTQAQQQRSTQTGVDLNAEAAKLLQFQQAYQAIGKLVTILDSLTQTVIDLIPPGGA